MLQSRLPGLSLRIESTNSNSLSDEAAPRRRLAANNLGPSADAMIDVHIKLMRLLALGALDAPEPPVLSLKEFDDD